MKDIRSDLASNNGKTKACTIFKANRQAWERCPRTHKYLILKSLKHFFRLLYTGSPSELLLYYTEEVEGDFLFEDQAKGQAK